jgi:hypothetical protein
MNSTQTLPMMQSQSMDPSNDYHRLPITEKQMAYARQIAASKGEALPGSALQDRAALSDWISENRAPLSESRFSNYPSSKQVAFAERIARIKRREVPRDCFQDRLRMSKWIDSNR